MRLINADALLEEIGNAWEYANPMTIIDLITNAPTIQLEEHDNDVIERCAKICESSDRHRGEYFASKIRALKGK